MENARLVVMGVSLGGLSALQVILGELPPDFPVPIAVVQHRNKESKDIMLRVLRHYSRLSLREPQDKEPISAGCVYIAPPDYHLMVDGENFSLSTDPPVSYARPSIDVLFESAADVFGAGVIGVIMTGANHDGAAGAARIKLEGGIVLAQDPKEAECPVMPEAAIRMTEVDSVLKLAEIAPALCRLVMASQ
jgi:two-component system, chemotaxis family, protein-glutamate methylesterase/glutaminase